MNRMDLRLFWIVLLVATVAGLSACGGGAKEVVQYHCPMHPTYVKDGPGDCPICGMDLVPVPKASPDTSRAAAQDMSGHTGMTAGGTHTGTTAANVPGYSPVHATPEAVSLAGVRTTPATRGRIERTVRAVGSVVTDETRTREVHPRVSGWIEGLFVDFTGQFVRRGDPLLTVYSPELVASEEEYMRARAAAARFAASTLPEVRNGADELVASARERLRSFDVPEALLERLDAGGAPERTVTLNAPATGFVTAKDVFAGSRIEPGMLLFTIADLSRIWIDVSLYEDEAPFVRPGQRAMVSLPYDPAFRTEGRVSYVYPTLDAATRTLRARVELPNADTALKPGMYADVSLALESAEGVIVPEDAVLDTGTRRVVFVRTPAGVFEPREVTLGLRSEGRALVLAGVSEGEQVVVGANFLLDSESRLRSAIGAAGAATESMPGMDMGADR